MRNITLYKTVSIRKSLFIILTILFVCLLCSSGFLFYKYIGINESEKAFKDKIKSLEEENERLNDNNSESTTKTKFSNATKPIEIDVEYGSGEATHPKVLYFSEGFNDYKYWMAYTPYYKAQDKYENPVIVVSNDGEKWTTIDGVNTPLDEPSNFKSGVNYNSDTHLVYNDTKKELEVWWRYVEGKKVILYRMITSDGKTFSDKEVVVESNRDVLDYISPSIIYDNGTYKMWFIFNDKLMYTQSDDLKQWSNSKELITNYNDDTLNNWHLDVIKDNDEYKMVMSAYYKNNNHVRMNLYYSSSKNGTDWDDFKVILTPTYATSNFDNMGIYRSSIVKVNNKYYLYYSAICSNESRTIGLIKVSDFKELFFN